MVTTFRMVSLTCNSAHITHNEPMLLLRFHINSGYYEHILSLNSILVNASKDKELVGTLSHQLESY